MSDELGNYFPLIQSTMEHFEIQEDIDTCDRTEQMFQRIQEKRKKITDESYDTLRALSRKLELAKAKTDPSEKSAAHREATQRLVQLDREKFALAKSLNELEQSNTSSQTTLDILRQELEDLKDADSIEETSSQYVDNAAVLKLKFYRSLGLRFSDDEDETGLGSGKTSADGQSASTGLRVFIQSSTENRVHVFSIDKNYSSQFVANYIWDHM
ncbi:spindle pole body protein Spc24 [Sugiyamaella lignohabitans]|uniref:Kinetochore protein Spc24 n=1 Tax=Sugiyamaella lignohabitans TaxID=796027 RepID=A0A167EDP1_9ASCO|nr:spindle pole body protein Spc24 [Sugiyamaella lignohabitans]ANB13942.1 spindle pole body protein Spc24 [Sugiyamaella lignohabitans]